MLTHCHACSVSKGVILQNAIPYTIAMQMHNKQADSASDMQRSKITEVESSIIEKEAAELKHKDLVIALYLTGRHSNKAKELTCLQSNLFYNREFSLSGMHLHAGRD